SYSGVPQRFLWKRMYDPEAPAVRPEWPAPLTVRHHPPQVVDVTECHSSLDQTDKHRLVVARGFPMSLHDGHKNYARLKFAYALAVLNGRVGEINEEDWWLSGIVIEVSDATRELAREARLRVTRDAAKVRGQNEGVAKVEAEASADEARE